MPTSVIQPRANLARDITFSLIIGTALTGVSYLAGVWIGWISAADIKWLEVFAVFTSYACTYLCVKERRINYPVGVVSSAAYAYLFLESGLLASAVLNAYLVPTLLYGWVRWRRDSNTRPVSRISLKWLPIYLLVAGLGYAGATLLTGAVGGSMAWTDSLILAGTILAQFLLDNKKLETWIVWAVVNMFAIYTYATVGLPLVAFQYVFFLANTVYGYILWNRSKRNDESLRPDDGYAAYHGTPATDSVR